MTARGSKTCVAALAAMLAAAGTSQAGTLTNGALTVNYSDANGSITSATFGGTEFFRRGEFVSNFMLQNGTTTETYRLNDANGLEQIPSTVAGNVVSGTYTVGGANLAFTRTYSLVPGQNVLRVATNFVNNASSPLTVSYADSFDPDQGNDLGAGFGTFNDVFLLGGGKVGQASINDINGNMHTVLAGSLDSRATVASGDPFSIVDGDMLNTFFASPVDGGGNFADSGTHIGIRTTLGAGASTSFTYDLAFGLTPTAAQAAFVAANPLVDPNPTAVPEPASMSLLALGAVGMFGYRLRRRTALAA